MMIKCYGLTNYRMDNAISRVEYQINLEQNDRQTDNTDSRVAFVTEKEVEKLKLHQQRAQSLSFLASLEQAKYTPIIN